MKRKAINIENIKDIREIQNQIENADMPDIPSSESLNNALEYAKERWKLQEEYSINREKLLMNKYGVKQAECHNEVCPYCVYNEYSFCDSKNNNYIHCLCRLLAPNPNHLDYDEEYIPTWQEALDLLSENELLKDRVKEECKKASLYYSKATTQDKRSQQEITGVTMKQAELAIKKQIDEYLKAIESDFNNQEEIDEFKSHISSSVIARNSVIEFEKIMGIYPNIQIRHGR